MELHHLNQASPDQHSPLLLAGAVVLAGVENTSVSEYAVRAIVGGVVWLAFKLAADYLSNRIKKGGK